MCRGVPEPDGGAQTVAHNDPHHDPEDAAETEEEPLLDEAESSDHDDHVEEDDAVADQQHPCVLEGLGLQRLEEHLGHEGVGGHILRLVRSVRHNLDHPSFKLGGILVQRLSPKNICIIDY